MMSASTLSHYNLETNPGIKQILFDMLSEEDKHAVSQTGNTDADTAEDPFSFNPDEIKEFSDAGLLASAKAAVAQGFHVFPLTPKDKLPLAGSNGFKDSRNPSDPLVLAPWNQNPTCNIGINLEASGLCVLDFDKPESVPAWLNDLKTFKVRTAKGVHIYFLGTRKTTKIYVDGSVVGDVKSQGGYVLSEGSVHPSGALYTVIDDSPIVQVPERVSELVKHDSERVNASEDGPPIPRGSHDTELFRIGCMLRNAGMNYQEIKDALINICQRRCENHGDDYVDMCERKAKSACRYPVGQANVWLLDGKPIVQSPPQVQTSATEWRKEFRNLSEMEQGDIVMIIDGVLQEGTCFLGANPGHGKTLVALAIAKAICLGEPLFGIPDYTVKEPRPVVYLIPESSDRAFRKRGEAFRLPPDDRFIARTISSGASLALSDPALIEAVRQMKPVVILDTASRFLKANDENSAAQNRMLVDDITCLRAAGAPLVIVLHHAKKSSNENKETMTLENMLRGTSDFGAMCDQAYGIRMDEHLFSRGAGPMEIQLVNLKDRERLGGLSSLRLAASYKKPGVVFPVSYINETGNFREADFKETRKRDEETLGRMVTESPLITVQDLFEDTGIRVSSIREILKGLGWHSARGGPDGHSPWHKEGSDGRCPYEKYKGRKPGKATQTITLDSPGEVVN